MEKQIRAATAIATLLDNKFKIGKFGFGIDTILEFLPIGGDTAVLVLSSALVGIAWQMGIPKRIIAKMIFNVLFAVVIGLIPFFGDIFYIFFKPNMRNLALIQKSVLHTTNTLQ